ncbi:hypothetical protein [Pseudomonas sp.]|uniref:hypothetical protein n=1 Tax=Pseudomonas sp. TaxID=306 RepID=UPI003C74C9D9
MTDKSRVYAVSAAVPPKNGTVSADAFPQSLFVGGYEMGALMREMSWSKIKLGPIETWPNSLKTMLGVVLCSRFPMLLWWGPELLHLYNDAYRPILRDKHPASLASPAAQIWPRSGTLPGPWPRVFWKVAARPGPRTFSSSSIAGRDRGDLFHLFIQPSAWR